MPRPFNRYPVGLLGLLDAKVRGQTPNELHDVTQASIELTPFLLAQSAEVITDDTLAITAVGRNFGVSGALTVPQDEIWFVHAYGVRPDGVLAAGTTYRFTGLHETVLGVGPTPLGGFYPTLVVQGGAGTRPVSGGNAPFWVAGGDQLGLFALEVTLGTASVFQLHAKVSRLRV